MATAVRSRGHRSLRRAAPVRRSLRRLRGRCVLRVRLGYVDLWPFHGLPPVVLRFGGLMCLTLGVERRAGVPRLLLSKRVGQIPRGGGIGAVVWTPFLHAGAPLPRSSC